jgi:hypothetical protein
MNFEIPHFETKENALGQNIKVIVVFQIYFRMIKKLTMLPSQMLHKSCWKLFFEISRCTNMMEKKELMILDNNIALFFFIFIKLEWFNSFIG